MYAPMDHSAHMPVSANDVNSTGADARYHVEGMHCASCATSLQSALCELPGVKNATVDFLSGQAVVNGTSDSPEVLKAIERLGYHGEIMSDEEDLFDARTKVEDAQLRSERLWKRRAFIGLSIWIPLESLHWILHGSNYPWLAWVMFAGSTVVMVLVGGGFLSSAFAAARRGGTNMDTLISIGASTAYVWSLIVLVFQRIVPMASEYWLAQPLYFAEAAALLGIISLGHWFEAKATARAGAAVRDLLELQPFEAERIGPDGVLETIPSRDVLRGEHLQVRPGGRVPVDGTVIQGESDIDESLMTGEAIPVLRTPGDSVVAGTTNTTGRLVIEATVDGRHTTVSRIAGLVQRAQASKAPIQRLADYVSSIFVPTVLAIALITLLVWGLLIDDWATGIVSTVTVLIISCPCALGLATPMAVMVGAGAASRRGILVKDASSLERAGRLRTVIFDKTGTLTQSRPVFSTIELLRNGSEERTEDDVLRLAASAEKPSEHPLASAIVSEAESRGIQIAEPSEFKAIPGKGVEASVQGQRIEVLKDEAASCQVLIDGEAVAKITVEDQPRPDASKAIARLREMGLQVRMLSGDRIEAAQRVGNLIGLHEKEVIAEATPEFKMSVVADAGEHVAMVGDGINDAAALAKADLGIAMASGTGAAIESANMVVPSDRVSAVAEAVDLARRTLRTIRQNLFLAFVYNSIAIPVAAFGLLGPYGPLFAAAAMGLSDVSVIGNALRLRAKLRRN